MPPTDPRARLTELATQAQMRSQEWPTGEGYELLDQLREQVRTRFAPHLATEYGVDVTDPDQARAAFATLEWLAATVRNAQANSAADPLGVVIQGLVGASHALAPIITGQETP